MVDEALTTAARALPVRLFRLAMRALPLVPAAFVAALALTAAPRDASADSPVVIQGVDEDMGKSIGDLLPDRDRPTSLFDAERIAEEAAARAMIWLRSEGYYGATVTPEAREEPLEARIVIEAGPRFSFDAPNISYAGEAPDAEAVSAVEQAIGAVRADAPARTEVVLTSEAAALAALQHAGYADAAIEPRRVVVDHATSRVAADFRFAPGERARLGAVRAEPDDLFRPRYIAHLRNWDEGELYSPDALTRLRRDLSSTGAVSVASTRLGPVNPDGTRDVILNVEPARRNAYEVGVAYSTTEGLGDEAEWTRRNLTRRADSLTVGATLAELQQGVSANWARPHAFRLGHTLNIGASGIHEDLAAYSRQGVAIYASVDASPRVRVGTSYGIRLSVDQYDETSGDIRDATLFSGFAAVRNDSTDQRLDARDGSIVELRLEPSISSGDESLGFVRAIADGRIYESFGENDHLTLAARVQTAWLEAVAGDPDHVPPAQRFYAGGGGSVRGYEYNSIYPHERDALGLTPGGQGLLEGSFEARYRFNARWGAVAFVDGGAAFDDWSEAGDLRWGVGAGVRYDLGFAPVRVDVAVPLDPEEAGADYALYVSLGQAF
jgi:translocation and assembly module TamA